MTQALRPSLLCQTRVLVEPPHFGFLCLQSAGCTVNAPKTLASVTHPVVCTPPSITLLSFLSNSWDIFLVTLAGMKLLRTSFCNPAHQYIHLSFTVIFFRFDCKDVSESFLLDFFLMSILFSKASLLSAFLILKCKRCISYPMF